MGVVVVIGRGGRWRGRGRRSCGERVSVTFDGFLEVVCSTYRLEQMFGTVFRNFGTGVAVEHREETPILQTDRSQARKRSVVNGVGVGANGGGERAGGGDGEEGVQNLVIHGRIVEVDQIAFISKSIVKGRKESSAATSIFTREIHELC